MRASGYNLPELYRCCEEERLLRNGAGPCIVAVLSARGGVFGAYCSHGPKRPTDGKTLPYGTPATFLWSFDVGATESTAGAAAAAVAAGGGGGGGGDGSANPNSGAEVLHVFCAIGPPFVTGQSTSKKESAAEKLSAGIPEATFVVSSEDRFAVGGSEGSSGTGLALQGDLQRGSTSALPSFRSLPLARGGGGGGGGDDVVFDIARVEVFAFDAMG